MKYRSVKGTKDILPDESYQWRYIENAIVKRLERNNYKEIRTPIFEVTELFVRSVGSDTDIVSKEMYTFLDKGGVSLTLRPELTAPVIRAYIQNNMNQSSSLAKVYYIGSLFRQERPQKGRLRQFHQFGFEIIGTPHPEADAEIIQTIYEIYTNLGIKELALKINSIGSKDTRKKYLRNLKKSLKPHLSDLCPTCQERFERNALRLFDCKSEECQDILDEYAPSILESLSKEDENHFDEVKRLLNSVKVPYTIDKKLVRGLDYYTRTTFEITNPLLGAQDAICGGGRYDDLIEDLGGIPTPAVGVASGMERLLMILNKISAIPEEKNTLVYLAVIGEEARRKGFELLVKLRQRDIIAEMDLLHRSLKAQMRDAGRRNAKCVAILGEDELKRDVIAFKDMSTGNQQEFALKDSEEKIVEYINNL
jgi:histidyl-tRNA synthetase